MVLYDFYDSTWYNFKSLHLAASEFSDFRKSFRKNLKNTSIENIHFNTVQKFSNLVWKLPKKTSTYFCKSQRFGNFRSGLRKYPKKTPAPFFEGKCSSENSEVDFRKLQETPVSKS